MLVAAPSGLVEVRMRDGSLMTIDMRSPTERDVFWTGDYDGATIDALARALAPGATVVDVGANIGFYTVRLARAGARVVAFEPMSGNAARIAANVEANDLGAHVTVVQLALGDTEGELVLVPEPGGASTGNAAPATAAAAGSVRVAMSTLDAEASLRGIDACDLLKIDVEGGELAVLRGGEAFVRRHRPRILLELNRYWMGVAGWTEHDLRTLAGSWDYEIAPVRGGSLEDVLLIPHERRSEGGVPAQVRY